MNTNLIVFFVLLVTFILLSPVFTIWSLNTLFNTSIEINICNYMATFWLSALVAGGNVKK